MLWNSLARVLWPCPDLPGQFHPGGAAAGDHEREPAVALRTGRQRFGDLEGAEQPPTDRQRVVQPIRLSPGSNKTNLGRLGGAWSMHLEDGKSPGTMQATPVVVDGVMFISPRRNRCRHRRRDRGDAVETRDRSGRNHRGVAVCGRQGVFGPPRQHPDRARPKNGAVTWTTQLADPGARHDQRAARLHDGLVYIGVGGGEGGVRGQFGAYDARTGKEVWKFWTLPVLASSATRHGKGIPGSTAAVQSGRIRRSIRISTWCTCRSETRVPTTMAPRAAATTCSPCPLSRWISKTGAYKWHFQEVHHDIWDYDNAAAPVLADVRYQGRHAQSPDARRQDRLPVHSRSDDRQAIGRASRSVPFHRSRG